MPSVSPDDGPVVVTGAAGYIGSQVVAALIRRGYEVRACVTDVGNPDKVKHLMMMNRGGVAGRVRLHAANLLADGSYDSVVAGCSAVLHAGTPMGHHGNKPGLVYDGALNGTRNLLRSVSRAGTVRRLVYTSSFAAVRHPSPPNYMFTEADWASDNRDEDPNWNESTIETNGANAYAMAKVATEKLLYWTAENDGTFDVMSVCPSVVLGPLLSPSHYQQWTWIVGKMLEGEPARAWQRLWNIIDVRDVGEAQALIVGSEVTRNGDRYILTATDASWELNVAELQAHLGKLFPNYKIGGPPPEYAAHVDEHGGPLDRSRARCDKARLELGLKTHGVDDTLFETGRTMVELGLITPMRKAAT